MDLAGKSCRLINMKFAASVILMLSFAFALGLVLPWWSIAIACFLVSLLIPIHPFDSFLAGFAGMALLWGGMAFYLSHANDHILAGKISVLMLKSDNPYLPVLVSALIGGLVGGLSSLSASWLRHKPKKQI